VVGRLLLGGVAWLMVLLLFAALLQRSGSSPHITSDLDGVDALSRAINKARLASGDSGRARWTVTKSTSALREMVVTVAAERPDKARTIAEQIIMPARADYEEILVYVHGLDQKHDPVVRRIEWTPHGGFTEMSFR
jgi:hypothetical protein